MMQNKFIFGITGGSGTGKTTVSGIFRKIGIEVIDCDVVAREVTYSGEPCLKELAEFFGMDILCENGELNRKKLGEIVFSSNEKLKKLNEITHKYILEKIFCMIEQSEHYMIGIDGAVLFESGVADRCDRMIGILADKPVRMHRIINRDNLSAKTAENRINSQKPDSFYINNCDFIIYNNGNTAELENSVKEVVSKLAEEGEKRKDLTF